MIIADNNGEKNWLRPWDKQPDTLYERDDRFFGIIIKGMLAWLTRNIVMYGEPIRHFIFNTGSSYMYVETNGYRYSVQEVTDQDAIYMHRPRCIATLGAITLDTAELTQPSIRGTYERIDSTDGQIKGYNAEIRRLPVEISVSLQYVMSTFNESLTLVQELIDKLCFQRYFSIIYLGQVIKCSIEFPKDFEINVNKIDMSSSEANNKLLTVPLTLCASYPSINEETEVANSYIMKTLVSNIETYYEDPGVTSDTVTHVVS